MVPLLVLLSVVVLFASRQSIPTSADTVDEAASCRFQSGCPRQRCRVAHVNSKTCQASVRGILLPLRQFDVASRVR